MTVITQWPVGYANDPESLYGDAIPFPAVPGGHYGDPRDGGARVHRGYDFTPALQWNVRAIADGYLYFRPPYIDNGDPLFPAGWASGGYQVWIQHDGFMSRYLHLYEDSPNTVGLPVPSSQSERPIYLGGQGTFVRRGDYIGTVGGTGWTVLAGGQLVPIGYDPHLHLEVATGNPGTANTGIDPIPFIRERLAANIDPNPNTQNGEDMYLVKDGSLGHVYLIGNQFIQHITKENVVANLRQAGVPFMEGNSGGTVKNIGTAMGVPMHVVYRDSDGMIRNASSNNFGGGGLWTIERRIGRLQGVTP